MDVKAVFLQGKPLDRDVFIKPTKDEAKTANLWKLKKCVSHDCTEVSVQSCDK